MADRSQRDLGVFWAEVDPVQVSVLTLCHPQFAQSCHLLEETFQRNEKKNHLLFRFSKKHQHAPAFSGSPLKMSTMQVSIFFLLYFSLFFQNVDPTGFHPIFIFCSLAFNLSFPRWSHPTQPFSASLSILAKCPNYRVFF